MKKTLISAMLLVGIVASAQTNGKEKKEEVSKGKVGINTDRPTATLDINANAENSKETANTNEGLLIPRLSKTRVAQMTTPSESTLVYVRDITYTGNDAKVSDINEKGFYYYDGTSKWVKAVKGNPIENQNTSAQTGNFYISGDGRADNIRSNSGDGGYAALKSGKAGRPGYSGYFEVRNSLEKRLGYIGWDNTNMLYQTENGAKHIFQGSNVGINVDDPEATLHIKETTATTTPQGVIFPKFSSVDRERFENVQEGTMIYNTTKKCLEMYFGLSDSGVPQWNCTLNAGSSQSQSIAVEPAGFTGSFVSGVQLSGNTVQFKLTNNSFSGISNVNFSDAVTVTGVQGVSVNGSANSSVSLQSGASTTLTYTLSGTPTQGTLTANFNKLGLTADQSTQVGLGSATFTNTSSSSETYVVSLVYRGTSVQGKINNSKKLTVEIPYTNGQGSYNAYESQPVRTAAGQGNDVNGLRLSIPGGNFSRTGKLTATITVDGDGEYLVRQLEPGKEYTIATIPVTINGATTNVVIKGIGGIPDKKFGQQTNGRLEHQFIYLPITGPDGRTWLNNNLGAEYARVGSPHFNPLRQAGGESTDPDTIRQDPHAYGSLFEWGRDSDGHELINWTSSTSGTVKYTGLVPGQSQRTFIDPCPEGYHTPDIDELQALFNIVGYSEKLWKYNPLKMPASGQRNDDNNRIVDAGNWMTYWSRTPTITPYAYYVAFNHIYAWTRDYNRTLARAIRCISDR